MTNTTHHSVETIIPATWTGTCQICDTVCDIDTYVSLNWTDGNHPHVSTIAKFRYDSCVECDCLRIVPDGSDNEELGTCQQHTWLEVILVGYTFPICARCPATRVPMRIEHHQRH